MAPTFDFCWETHVTGIYDGDVDGGSDVGGDGGHDGGGGGGDVVCDVNDDGSGVKNFGG